jgi:hypothetical protein
MDNRGDVRERSLRRCASCTHHLSLVAHFGFTPPGTCWWQYAERHGLRPAIAEDAMHGGATLAGHRWLGY